MATIAVLGMGLLGSGFAENLLTRGHSVRVWNRTASKCAPLVALGAVAASSPADAVRGAERVHLVLAEDTAVDAVIDALRPALSDGAPIVDHSTNLPAGVDARVARLAGSGVRYLHAPVFMGPQHSKTATGLMLASGDPALIAGLKPALETMTGRVLVLGPEPSRAAATKLVGNGVLIMLTSMMGDAFAVARGAGLSADDVLSLLAVFQPTPAGMGKRVLDAGKGPVGFELSMARKDVRLMIETAPTGSLTVLPAVAACMDRALAEGRAADDFAVFALPR
jgi:3-hydroxyisobutyrate dehydrogenase